MSRGLVKFVTLVAFLLVPADSSRRITATEGDATVVLAGGCFWGVEAVFEHVRGVRSVTSGFARYSDPSSPAVEAVRIVHDPSLVSYRQLLEVFFLVAHDPTSKDRQGPDVGALYRAVVLYQTPAEREAAEAYMAELTRSGRFRQPLVTEVHALSRFSIAGDEHQDYAARHPTEPYIVQNDVPKLERLQLMFPALYKKLGRH
jgi:peptide-methionine (S)-S-oxide reductase